MEGQHILINTFSGSYGQLFPVKSVHCYIQWIAKPLEVKRKEVGSMAPAHVCIIWSHTFVNLVLIKVLFFRSTLLQSRPKMSVHIYVRLSIHKKFLRFQWNLACRWRLMSDARQYAVWPNRKSRSRAFQSWKSGYFQHLSPPPFTMGAGNWPIRPDFWYPA